MSLSRYTLTSLARTSKSLHAVSIHALWEYLEGLGPLLRLLPPGPWTEDPSTSRHGISVRPLYWSRPPDISTNWPHLQHITPPDQVEWTRFNHYAKHVQRLYWQDERDVSPYVLAALSAYRPAGQPLLPQLRELTWDETCEKHFPFVHLFLTPNIRRLKLTLSDFNPPTMMALFEHVGSACKRVDHLTIRTGIIGDEMWESMGVVDNAFTQLLRSLPELRHFIGEGYLPASCIEALAGLPKLAVLELYVHSEEMHMIAPSAFWSSRHGQWFNALENLELYMDQMDGSTVSILSAIQSGKLQELRVGADYQPDTYMLKAHFDIFARAAYRNSLTSLRLHFDRPLHETTPCPALDVAEALEPLYACPHIDILHIRTPSLVASAHALQGIAHAWRLASLSLVSNYYSPTAKSRLTLEGLIPLARHCPDLRELELPVSADAVPDSETLAQLLPAPSRCALRSLAVFDAAIEDAHAVADFLARVFPAISVLQHVCTAEGADWFDTYDSETHDRWATVRRLLLGEVDSPVQWPDDSSESEPESE
ncbi:hypothetical protein TRAPUB_1348 [Trametes pubescens]|uniref:F-box domain-containing protein n=1 Tax=Trametes pubescens TaxID=154538 RepID=A0A1M2VJL4_TRAPU|nr:hypothetical protein TRAPUB_1348 [Trametes pubescens]